MNILVIQGPNINLLGLRNPKIYGELKMEEIHNRLSKVASDLGCQISFFQSNHEGQIVDVIQKANGVYDYLLINAAAYTHTSIAIRDAIEAIAVPVIEVHLSNIHARDDFRHKSLIAPVCKGQISGFGYLGYEMALRIAVSELKGV
ncbi:MAG: 3-dehydroquinate dehydratase [Clostridia bacterium]|jgi:3-dehydroquinate dehydratase-2|nr:3-dehydroquinate dehydratase [Clostridia bacterium]MDN5323040.1 3-dehydroquinate dehydratase [Clostridia bacterium]